MTSFINFRRAVIASFVIVLASATLNLGSRNTVAQEIPRSEYLRYMPLKVPRIVRQTQASAQLHLYGDRSDSAYVDAEPMDGIDDSRARVLRGLGVRFAPFLVQGSEQIPMDARRFAERTPLSIDTWNTANGIKLVSQETTEWTDVASKPCNGTNQTSDDCRLLELLRAYHPDHPGTARERAVAVDPETVPFEVLFVDLPGAGPKSWKREFRSEFSSMLREEYRGFLKTFIHPFLEQVEAPSAEPLFQLVLQYWFFYPYNDGGNNHEGDWEHINVIVSPLDRVTAPGLTAVEVTQLLDGTGDSQTVMKRVDYYFHSKVMIVDFSAPNAYAQFDEWKDDVKSRSRKLAGIEKRWAHARYMAFRDAGETEINTHPIGFIGADNKGIDQLFSAPGGTNRDGHGTYPQRGLYRDVGTVGAAESIGTSFDHKVFFASSEVEQTKQLTRYARGGLVFLGKPELVELIPDYERIIGLVMTDVEARQQWAWLVLPVRWGYPAVSSPFAGVVSHTETGNLAVVGPAFNTGWNRSGAKGQYQLYEPHALARLWPLGLQDAFKNDWGFLNATLPVLSFLPPFDLVWRVVAAPFRLSLGSNDPIFVPQAGIPSRFVGLTLGVTIQQIPAADYSDLFYNREQYPLILATVLEHITNNSPTGEGGLIATDVFGDDAVTGLFQLQFYVGDRLSSVNTFRHSRTDLGITLRFSEFPEAFTVGAELNFWEYAGSMRYNLLTGALQPYLKGGWGLSWYRLETVRANGELLDVPDSPWIRKPALFENLLPNTWHFGFGVELIAIRSFAQWPKGIDVGLVAEWLTFSNKLGLDLADIALEELVLIGTPVEDLPRNRIVHRSTFNVGLSFGF